MPSASIAMVNGDKNLLIDQNQYTACLLGVDNRSFIKYKFGNNRFRQEISYISLLGKTTLPDSLFNTNLGENTNDYILSQTIDTLLETINNKHGNTTYIDTSKLLYTFLCKSLKNNDFKIELGLNENVQIDSSGYFNAGWFKYDPRQYLGYGFEGFVNPFIWNHRTIGISMAGECSENIKFFGSYGVPHRYASESNSPVSGTSRKSSPARPLPPRGPRGSRSAPHRPSQCTQSPGGC